MVKVSDQLCANRTKPYINVEARQNSILALQLKYIKRNIKIQEKLDIDKIYTNLCSNEYFLKKSLDNCIEKIEPVKVA